MKSLRQLLRSIPEDRRSHWTLSGDRIQVLVGGAERYQEVRVAQVEDLFVLTSVVLGSRAVTKSHRRRRQVAVEAWRRNADLQLVGFEFDNRERLIGKISHPADHLDPEELELYVNALARECDAFEYVLSGEDRH